MLSNAFHYFLYRCYICNLKRFRLRRLHAVCQTPFAPSLQVNVYDCIILFSASMVHYLQPAPLESCPEHFDFFFILQVLSQHQHPLIFHMKIADGGLLKNKDCCHEALILYVIMNLSTVIDTLASFFLYLYLLHFLFHFIYSMVQYRCCIIVIEVTPEHRRLFKIS